MWYDELGSIMRADGRFGFYDPGDGVLVPKIPVYRGPRGGLDRVIDEPQDTLPPLYFLALRAWKAAVGEDEFGVRSLSALCGVVTVGAAFGLTYMLVGTTGALAAGLLVATSAFEVDYSQEARPYAMFAMWSLVSTWLFVLVARTGSCGHRARFALWAGYAVSIAAGLSTHVAMVLTIGCHALAYLIWRRKLRLARWPVVVALSGLLLAPFVAPMARQVGAVGSSVTQAGHERSEVSWLEARAHVPAAARSLVNQLLGWQGVGADRWPCFLAVAFAICAGGVVLWKTEGGGVVVACALVGPVVLVGLDTVLGTHHSSIPRYAMASSVPLWIVMAVSGSRLRGRLRWLFGAVVLVALSVNIVGLRGVYAAGERGGGWKACAQQMMAVGCDERDVVILVPNWATQCIELNYHLRGNPAQAVVLSALSQDALARPWRHVFVVVYETRIPGGDQLRQIIAQRYPTRGHWAFDRVTLSVHSRTR